VHVKTAGTAPAAPDSYSLLDIILLDSINRYAVMKDNSPPYPCLFSYRPPGFAKFALLLFFVS